MPFALSFYHDQVSADGATSGPLPSARRIIFVRHGSVNLNGTIVNPGQAKYFDGPVQVQGEADWSQLWRWDLVEPIEPSYLLEGSGVLSSLRMSRVISALPSSEGGQWLFRLDQVASAAGRVSNPHQPAPGIRCLIEGTFNINQNGEHARGLMPGDPWWESGEATVIAWGSPQMKAVIIRAMIMPPEMKGKPTGTWLTLTTPEKRGNWDLHVDQIIDL